MDDLVRVIRDYNVSNSHHHINLSEEERNKLLTKINSINRQLVVQKITPEKVKEQGTFTDEFTIQHGSSFHGRLPMDFIKENHVYFPTFFKDTLMIGIEVIMPVSFGRGAICYFQKRFAFDSDIVRDIELPPQLTIAAIKENGWSAYATEDNGIYVLNLGGRHRGFLNWNEIPFKNK